MCYDWREDRLKMKVNIFKVNKGRNLGLFLGALPNNQKCGASKKLKKSILFISQNVPGSMQYKSLTNGDTIRDFLVPNE